MATSLTLTVAAIHFVFYPDLKNINKFKPIKHL